VGVNHLFAAPPTRKAYPIAILLHARCAIYAPPPTPLLYAIHHTILVITISCIGQVGKRPMAIATKQESPQERLTGCDRVNWPQRTTRTTRAEHRFIFLSISGRRSFWNQSRCWWRRRELFKFCEVPCIYTLTDGSYTKGTRAHTHTTQADFLLLLLRLFIGRGGPFGD